MGYARSRSSTAIEEEARLRRPDLGSNQARCGYPPQMHHLRQGDFGAPGSAGTHGEGKIDTDLLGGI